jgi:hypothetical protein
MPQPKDDFKKLKAKWYKKLKDETDFVDIEYEDGSMTSCLPRSPRNKIPYQQELIRDYYYMCYHFLNEHDFTTELEKVIWEYHTEGISVRDIVVVLKKIKIKTDKTTVGEIVKKLGDIMKSRYLQT